MKKILFIFITLGIIILLLSVRYVSTKPGGPRVNIGGHEFSLEIAKAGKEQEIGLSKYKDIPQNFGMLFPFGKVGYYSFWMKDMKFAIDIIFIKDNKIVTIFKDVPAPKSFSDPLPIYRSSSPADTVLEITGGLSQKYNFQNGQVLSITY
jgi:uncharacterized membrane protein (UPF0127 family)